MSTFSGQLRAWGSPGGSPFLSDYTGGDEYYTFTPRGGATQSFSSRAARDAAQAAHDARYRARQQRLRAEYRAKQQQKLAREEFQKALEQYEPGGGYGKGVKAMLSRRKAKTVAGGQQALISAGLGGTSQMAGLGKKFEEEVGVPTMAEVESQRATAIANLRAKYGQMAFQSGEAAYGRAGQLATAGMGVSGQLTAAGIGASGQQAIANIRAGVSRAGLALKAKKLTSQSQTALEKLTSELQKPKPNLPRQHLGDTAIMDVLGSNTGSDEPYVVRGYGPMFGD